MQSRSKRLLVLSTVTILSLLGVVAGASALVRDESLEPEALTAPLSASAYMPAGERAAPNPVYMVWAAPENDPSACQPMACAIVVQTERSGEPSAVYYVH